MKKIVSIFTTLLLCLALMLPMTVSAASASATLTGPAMVRAGDTITLSFNLKGSGIFGASGTLSYDGNQVSLSKTAQKIGSPWAVEFNGNNFVAYDNNLSNPINGTKTLFTATFKVKSVAPGTKITISYTGVAASDGNADANIGTVSYSVTVAAPMSTDNKLASLAASNATISPAFSPEVTSYTASVPFEVSKLNVSATAADSKAKVSVNSPNLTPNGTTNVTITVTAENGAKKTYTISVKRAQDPNYQPSGNNNLSGITVDGFLLSPVFKADTTQYVVWLPYETASVQIRGTAQDSKASVEVVGGENLAAGQDNPVKVICIAENGSKKEYTVIVKRAASHDGTVTPPVTSTVAPTSSVAASVSQTNPPASTAVPSVSQTQPSLSTQANAQTSTGSIAWWWLIVVGVVSLAIGFVVGKSLTKKK